MIGDFFHSIFEVFFVIGYLVLFVISIIILKPFRIHRKRPKSTVAIKLSYLVFLLFFLIFTYLLLFGPKNLSAETIPYDTLFNVHFLIFMSSTIIPNMGIMIRRGIIKKRIEYNVIFTAVNSIYILYLLYAIFTSKWSLM